MSKYEFSDDVVQAMSVTEVVEQLLACGAFEVGMDKRMGEARLEYGTDLEIDIMENDPMDPRIDGFLSHTETFTLSDIREHFEAADYYAWAKDEDGSDVLLCFGC